MISTLSRGRLVILVVGCVIGASVFYYFQHSQVTGFYSSSPNDKYVETRDINSLTVPDIAALLIDRLSRPSDLAKVVLKKSCEEIAGHAGCFDKNCKQVISLDPKTRINDLFSTGKLTLSQAQRDQVLSIAKTIPESDVIIASASSSNHYHEMQAMFQSLHQVVYPKFSNFSVVLFDIGLSLEERRITEKNCKCQVVSFPAEIFPPHVKNNLCYSWKPLIILATVSRARKYLVWQDSSVRWFDNFRVVFDRTQVYGHQFLRFIDSSRVPSNTIKQTFDYIGDEPCAYLPYPEVQGNCMLHKRDPFVIQAILEPWVRCALEKDCICPADPGSVLGCKTNLIIHRCHRFDQSALTIILAKVYGEDMYRFISPEKSFDKPEYIFVRRGHAVNDYFKS
ncbi:hypothetical protein Bpfe_005711 [Biomphalaria pfeifferi]|uniref:Uncharacterized protein n=1 Tax=Biomphalaria pfeifferi TaxID=112525 RepID=A0AAD8FGX3_BIOPF|nr:hypothetical protein Bpfe_005711 [Biomphalaria pfeifferi]